MDDITKLKQALVKERIIGNLDLAALQHSFFSSISDNSLEAQSITNELLHIRMGKLLRLAGCNVDPIHGKLASEEIAYMDKINAATKELQNQIIKK